MKKKGSVAHGTVVMQEEAMPENATTVITISRQLASGGAYIGHLVAKRLGYKYAEREVLYRAAGELGVDIPEAAKLNECCSGLVQNLMKSFIYGTPEAVYFPPSRRPLNDEELFKTECKIMKAIAEQYNAVIIGHGGFSVLRNHPRVLHVFIHAPMEFRIKRLQQFHEITTDQAREDIEESDRKREKFLRKMTNSDRYDARNYHLSIDAGAAGFETAQQMIVGLVEKMNADRKP
jgi:cytidylate kinase